MGLYHLEMDELAEYKGCKVDELKAYSYAELESMIADMKKDKIIKRNKMNAKDKEFERLVLKFFEPLSLLRPWFTDNEIVLACANTGVTESQLCQEHNVPVGNQCSYIHNAEFIRRSWESIPQYDSHGRELMERKREQRDVFRIASRYQGLCHGEVFLHLLYSRYPELSKYGFSAYSMSGSDRDYEIYPKNGIYVPFTALMSGDVDRIMFRNREYCKSYNNGRYTEAECEKAFRTEEAQEMFSLIYDIGMKERREGHFSLIKKDDRWQTVDGLDTKKVSQSGNVTMLSPVYRYEYTGRKPFKLDTATTYTAKCLASEFISMIPEARDVNIHVCHNTDFLRKHGLRVRRNDFHKGDLDLSGYIVNSNFGWFQDNKYSLIIRIECPEMMEDNDE